MVEPKLDADSVQCLVQPSPTETVTPDPTGTPVVTDTTPTATPDPSSTSGSGLAATGGADMTPYGVGAAIVLLAGIALLVSRRVLAKR